MLWPRYHHHFQGAGRRHTAVAAQRCYSFVHRALFTGTLRRVGRQYYYSSAFASFRGDVAGIRSPRMAPFVVAVLMCLNSAHTRHATCTFVVQAYTEYCFVYTLVHYVPFVADCRIFGTTDGVFDIRVLIRVRSKIKNKRSTETLQNVRRTPPFPVPRFATNVIQVC